MSPSVRAEVTTAGFARMAPLAVGDGAHGASREGRRARSSRQRSASTSAAVSDRPTGASCAGEARPTVRPASLQVRSRRSRAVGGLGVESERRRKPWIAGGTTVRVRRIRLPGPSSTLERAHRRDVRLPRMVLSRRGETTPAGRCRAATSLQWSVGRISGAASIAPEDSAAGATTGTVARHLPLEHSSSLIARPSTAVRSGRPARFRAGATTTTPRLTCLSSRRAATVEDERG